MSWAVVALSLASLPVAADAPRGDRATPHPTSRVVSMRAVGEAGHDPGGRLAARRDRKATGTLRLRIVERKADQTALVPARVHLADAGGKPVLAAGLPRGAITSTATARCGSTCLPAATPTPSSAGPSIGEPPGTHPRLGRDREQEVRLPRLIDLAAWAGTRARRTYTDPPTTSRFCSAPRISTWPRSSPSGTGTTTGKIGPCRRGRWSRPSPAGLPCAGV